MKLEGETEKLLKEYLDTAIESLTAIDDLLGKQGAVFHIAPEGTRIVVNGNVVYEDHEGVGHETT